MRGWRRKAVADDEKRIVFGPESGANLMVKKRGVGAAALADGDSDIQVSHRFEKPRDSQRSAVQRRESTTGG